jgi:hypothetical protein
MLAYDDEGNEVRLGEPKPAAPKQQGMGLGLSVMQRLSTDPDLKLQPHHAAGVVGNLATETGWFKNMQEIQPTVAGSRGGYGWAQWTGPRRQQFEAFARDKGLDINSDEANYQFLKQELLTTERAALEQLKQATNYQEASDAFMAGYERPGVAATGSRRRNARKLMMAFGNGETAADAPSIGYTDDQVTLPKAITDADVRQSMQAEMPSAPSTPVEPPSLLQRSKNLLNDVGSAIAPPPVKNLTPPARPPELLRQDTAFRELESGLQMNLNPQFVEQVQQAYEASTPEQRQRLMEQPGETGQVARYIDRKYQSAAGVTSLNPRLAGIGGRREDVTARNLGGGMEPQSAAMMADREVRFPGAMKPTGQIQSTTFDFERANQLRNAGPLARGVEQGVDQIKSQAAGLNKMAGDLGVALGIPGAADYSRAQMKARDGLKMRQNEVGEAPNAFNRNLEGAIASTLANAPGMVAGLFTGGSAGPLLGMGAQVAGDEYARGIDEGLDSQQAFARSIAFGAAEIIGEKLGFKDQVQLLKNVAKGSWAEFEKLFVRNLAEQAVGEQFTTVAEARIDGSPVGLNKELTAKELFNQMKETLYQTVLQTTIMGAPGAMGAAARSLKKTDTRYDQQFADAFAPLRESPESAAAYDNIINQKVGKLWRENPEFKEILRTEALPGKRGIEQGRQARAILAEREAIRASAPPLSVIEQKAQDLASTPAQNDKPEDTTISSTGIPGATDAQDPISASAPPAGQAGQAGSAEEIQPTPDPATTTPGLGSLKEQGYTLNDLGDGRIAILDPQGQTYSTYTDAQAALDAFEVPPTQEITNERQNQETSTAGQEGLLDATNPAGSTGSNVAGATAGTDLAPGAESGAGVGTGDAGIRAESGAPDRDGGGVAPASAAVDPLGQPALANETTQAPIGTAPQAGQPAPAGAGVLNVETGAPMPAPVAPAQSGIPQVGNPAATADRAESAVPLTRQPEQNTKVYWDALDDAGKSAWAEELGMPEIRTQAWEQIPLQTRRLIKGVSAPQVTPPATLTAKQEGELRGQNAVRAKLGKPPITAEEYLASVQSDLAASNRNDDVISEYNAAVDRQNTAIAQRNGGSGGVLRARVKRATALPRRGFVQRKIAESIAKVFGHRIVYIEHETAGKPLDVNGSIVTTRPDVILLASDSTDTLSRVAAHELTHGLRMRAPEVYSGMVKALREVYSPIRVMEHLEDRDYGTAIPSPSDDPMVRNTTNINEEEWVADFVSDVMHKPMALFRVAVAMNRNKKNSGGRFLRHVDNFLSSLTQKLSGAGFNAEAAIAKQNLQRARNAVTEALAQYANYQQTGAEPSFEGPEILDSKSRLTEEEKAARAAEREQERERVRADKEQEKAARRAEKNALAVKGFDTEPTNTRIIPATLADINFITSAVDLAKSKKWGTGRDFRVELDRRINQAAKAARVDLRAKDQATYDYLVNMAYREAQEALRVNPSAIGWYDDKLTIAMDIMGEIYPELKDDPQAQFAFIWALAVTSNGMAVDKNFRLADKAYSQIRITGRMPENIGEGPARKQINEGLKSYNDMMDAWGYERLQKFMTTLAPVRNIEKATGRPISGEGKDEMVYGSIILGPKIGNGFFSNLYGHYEQLTMDRWFMRTWNRWIGDLVTIDRAAINDKRQSLDALIRMLDTQEKRELQDVLGGKLLLSDLNVTAELINKASQKPENRDAMNPIGARDPEQFIEIYGDQRADRSRTHMGAEIRKAGNNLLRQLQGLNDAPKGVNQRKFIRAVFNDALTRLREEYDRLTMADFQAVIWYPEKKRLYEAAKLKEESGDDYEEDAAPDYANAARNLRASKEGTLGAIGPATGFRGGQRGLDAGNAGVSGRVGQDNGVGKTDIPASNRRDSGVNAEVAPNPQLVKAGAQGAIAKFEALPYEGKARVTKKVGDAILPKTLDKLGIEDYRIEYTLGGFLGGVNPSIVVHFGETVDYDQQLEFARVVGLLWKQQAMIAYNENDRTNGVQNQFVKVTPSRKLSAAEEGELFRAIYATYPDAEGVTARDGALVLGNFSEGKVGEKEFHDGIDAALTGLDVDYAFETNTTTFRSDWIEPETPEGYLEGTRYGKSNSAGDASGRDLSRWKRDFDAIQDESDRAFQDAVDSEADIPASNRREEAAGRTDAGSVPESGRVRGSERVLAEPRRPYQGDGRLGTSLQGLPSRIEVDGELVEFAGYAPAQEAARRYMEKAGLKYNPVKQYAKVNKARAKRIADAFDAMPHNPQNAAVRMAYRQMIKETAAQYQAILDTGLQIEFIDMAKTGDPYGNPRNAILDVVENNHLWMFSTRDGFGSSEDFDPVNNPLLQETQFKISGQVALANDLFRAVHDYFGHIKEGVGFRAEGEENAWRIHSSMYSSIARRAMTTETRGQNSWVNFGPFGEYNQTASGENTKYADQKIGLLPKWVSDEGATDTDIPASNRRSDAASNERVGGISSPASRPAYGQTKRGAVRGVGVHFSGSERQELDGSFYGTGAKGEEADRVKRAADKRLDKRIYFYINAGQGVSPEQGVGGNAHTVLLKNLYDKDADPLSILENLPGNTVEEYQNNMESAILDAGFDGYVADFGTQRAAVLIGDHKVPVRFEGQTRPQVEEGERAEPNTNKRLARLMGQEWSQKTPQAWGEFVKSKNPFLFERYADAFTGTREKFWPDEMASRVKSGVADIPASNRRKQTESPEFKKWFGDSKVVDEKGEPLVVYHGGRKDLEGGAFKPGYDGGVFFTDNKRVAGVHKMGLRGGAIHDVYLSLQNPYVVDFRGSDITQDNAESALRDAQAGKHDGVIIRNFVDIPEDKLDVAKRFGVRSRYKSDIYIAFSPTQIKSAIGNSGAFDASNPDIRFSNRRNVLDQIPLVNWTAPDEAKLDDWIYMLVDKQIDTKRVVEKLKASDAWNPYQKETLYHGKAEYETNNFKVNEVKPLLDAMSSRGISIGDLETYLWNRHAPEANEYYARVNPDQFPDGGSGIKTQDALDYLANLPAGVRTDLEAIANQVDAILRETRALLVREGLETQETIDAWEAAYQHYIPLQRESAEISERGMGTGQGFSVKGPASKRRTGSGKAAADILAQVMMQRERVITRAEKNRVALSLYGLAIQNPNPGFWYAVNPDAITQPAKVAQELIDQGMLDTDIAGIIKEPTEARINPRTGLVEHKINPMLRNRPNVLAVRIKGKDRFLFFSTEDARAVRMAESLKNLDAADLGGVWNLFRTVTRYVSSINTQYNPIFGVVNLIRDTQGGLLNLSSTPLAGQQGKVMTGVGPALRGIYADLRADRKGQPRSGNEWSKLWEEFQQVGGKTGYRDMFRTAEDRGDALQKELQKAAEGKLKRFGRGVFDWLSDYNETLENAVRLSAYKAGIESGMTKDQSAVLAKDLTVNFNRKGQIASQMGSLYAFFNASAQGSVRLAQTLRGPAGKKIMAGGILLGVMQSVLMAMAGYDDDEPPEFVRERNFILPIGDGKYLTVPYPLGFHALPNMGRVVTDIALSGGRDGGKKVAGLLGSLFETFNPIGSAGWSVQTIAPTFADPLVALSENRDSFGKPIAKEDRSSLSPTPGFSRTKDTASVLSKKLAWGINRLSGGSEYTQGVISPTPDQLDFLFGQVTGGVGREVMKLEQAATSWMSGEELPPYKYPLGVGRFIGNTNAQASDANRFYANLTRLNELEGELKGRAKEGEDVRGFMKDNPEASLVGMANAAETTVTKLRSMKRKMIAARRPKAEVKQIETRIQSVMKSLNDRVRPMRESPIERALRN